MAKNRSSFGDAASRGLRESYGANQSADVPATNEPIIVAPTNEPAPKEDLSFGINPYYDYHPNTGKKGGTLGRPRAETKRTQISIGCTESEKAFYKRAAASDGRKLPDFINRAVLEYVSNHNLDV